METKLLHVSLLSTHAAAPYPSSLQYAYGPCWPAMSQRAVLLLSFPWSMAMLVAGRRGRHEQDRAGLWQGWQRCQLHLPLLC